MHWKAQSWAFKGRLKSGAMYNGTHYIIFFSFASLHKEGIIDCVMASFINVVL